MTDTQASQDEFWNDLRRQVPSDWGPGGVDPARTEQRAADRETARRQLAEHGLDGLEPDEMWEALRRIVPSGFGPGTSHDLTAEAGASPTLETAPAKPTAQFGPYLDDDQRLRSPNGDLVDVMAEDWWQEPWYRQGAELLRQAGYEHVGEQQQEN